jgi:hypothetical protein
MRSSEPTELGSAEREEFLGTGGTGVISLSTAAEEAPHSIPVSYGYDPAETTFYFRLAVGSESGKEGTLDRPVSFVVHGSIDGAMASVVANGRSEGTTDNGIASETLDGMQRVRIPLFDIFGKPSGEVDFEFYRLVPEELTGRRESSTAP